MLTLARAYQNDSEDVKSCFNTENVMQENIVRYIFQRIYFQWSKLFVIFEEHAKDA